MCLAAVGGGGRGSEWRTRTIAAAVIRKRSPASELRGRAPVAGEATVPGAGGGHSTADRACGRAAVFGGSKRTMATIGSTGDRTTSHLMEGQHGHHDRSEK